MNFLQELGTHMVEHGLQNSANRMYLFKVLRRQTMMMKIVSVVLITDELHLALFPAGTIVKDPHHRESPTRRELVFNLRRT